MLETRTLVDKYGRKNVLDIILNHEDGEIEKIGEIMSMNVGYLVVYVSWIKSIVDGKYRVMLPNGDICEYEELNDAINAIDEYVQRGEYDVQ